MDDFATNRRLGTLCVLHRATIGGKASRTSLWFETSSWSQSPIFGENHISGASSTDILTRLVCQLFQLIVGSGKSSIPPFDVSLDLFFGFIFMQCKCIPLLTVLPLKKTSKIQNLLGFINR